MPLSRSFVALFLGISLVASTPGQDDPVVKDIMSRGWPDTRYTLHYHVAENNLLSDDMIEKTVGDVLARYKDDGLDDAAKASIEKQTRAPISYRHRVYDCYFVRDMNSSYFEETLMNKDGGTPASKTWSAFADLTKATILIHTRDPYLDPQDAPIIARVGVRNPNEGVDFAPLFGVQLHGLNPLPDPLVGMMINSEPDRHGYRKCMAPYAKKSAVGSFDWKAGYMQTADFEGQQVVSKYVAGDFNKPWDTIEFSNYRMAEGVPVAGKVVIKFNYYDYGLGDITSAPAEEVTLTLDDIRSTPDTKVSALTRGLFTPDTFIHDNKADGTEVKALFRDQPGLIDELIGSN